MTRWGIRLYLGTIGALFLGVTAWYAWAFHTSKNPQPAAFDGERALRDVQQQVDFGPRVPGSEGHARALTWMRAELLSAGWQSSVQEATSLGHPIQNVIGFRSNEPPQVILGAHYDTRLHADQDPDPKRRMEPVPGANDGGSGVAVLLEIARTLPPDAAPAWIVFFDAEDNGNISGWDWLLGSKAFVASMTLKPEAMILVDMVGGPELSIPMEGNSDPALRESIWETARQLGYANVFLPQVKYTIDDDHLPFVEAGVPAVDIIDFDYSYWHTTADTPDHVSATSLQIVGEVLQTWLSTQVPTKK